ncbi:MAG: hypothetical protein SGILL_008916, partial [Bacillariaceae sp.]
MGEFDFDKSSQARYWVFDEESLQQCREKACQGAPKVRKFASGYANRNKGKETEGSAATTTATATPPPPISTSEQERLVAFHAKELQTLVGPLAMFPALRMGSSTLSSAIMIFKRFYLSNAVTDFHPRDIACAAASLASKLESIRLPIDLLSHATYMVQAKAQHVLQEELKPVSIPEIEAAERALLQGCDGFFRCHHPYGACKALASEIANYVMSEPTQEFYLEGGDCRIQASPKSVMHDYAVAVSPRHQEVHDLNLSTLSERALSLAQWALVYSDVNFLFAPGKIAFAAVAVALDGAGHGTRLGEGMRQYLEMRFRNKTLEELDEFEGQIGKIISLLEDCSSIDLAKFSPNWQYCQDGAVHEHEAAELHQIFYKVSHLRSDNGKSARSTTPPQTSLSPVQPMGYYDPHGYGGYNYHDYHHHHPHYNHYHQQLQQHHTYNYPPQPQHFLPITEGSRKRGREEDHYQQHAAELSHAHFSKVARVTP